MLLFSFTSPHTDSEASTRVDKISLVAINPRLVSLPKIYYSKKQSANLTTRNMWPISTTPMTCTCYTPCAILCIPAVTAYTAARASTHLCNTKNLRVLDVGAREGQLEPHVVLDRLLQICAGKQSTQLRPNPATHDIYIYIYPEKRVRHMTPGLEPYSSNILVVMQHAYFTRLLYKKTMDEGDDRRSAESNWQQKTKAKTSVGRRCDQGLSKKKLSSCCCFSH